MYFKSEEIIGKSKCFLIPDKRSFVVRFEEIPFLLLLLLSRLLFFLLFFPVFVFEFRLLLLLLLSLLLLSSELLLLLEVTLTIVFISTWKKNIFKVWWTLWYLTSKILIKNSTKNKQSKKSLCNNVNCQNWHFSNWSKEEF